MRDLSHYWYRQSFSIVTFLLLPLSWLFGLCAGFRRWLYRAGIIKTHRFTVPVIVVGNITVGGTGKTPFVIWLARFLQSQGFRPGIVSRGVGSKKQTKPYWVTSDDTAARVGDEAILLVQQTGCPVVIGVDRVAVVRDLLQHASCNIVISDDGLQHYRLSRNIEIAIMDGERRCGNQYLLPAGPLREPVWRLNTVDFVVVNGGNESDAFTMMLTPEEFVSLQTPQQKWSVTMFPHKKVHAVAGIGHPGRFFRLLKQMGFDVIEHPFPDHYAYQAHDFDFNDTLPILMTEKDAVKCSAFADQRYWYLRVTAQINDKLEQALLKAVSKMGVRHDSEEDFSKPACHIISCSKHDTIRE